MVDLGCIGHFNPKLITVRSKSGDLLSNDSSAVPIVGGSRKRQLRVSISGGNHKCLPFNLLSPGLYTERQLVDPLIHFITSVIAL